MQAEFDFSDVESLMKEIEKWPGLALTHAYPAMQDAVLFLHGNLPDAPEASADVVKRPDGASFLTDKQRRWFFAAVQAGDIPGWRWVESAGRQMIAPETRTQFAKFKTVGSGHPEKFASARTNTLQQRFTTDVERKDNVIRGLIGTNVPYAPWVVGPAFPGEEIGGEQKYQARIHEDRWYQFDEFVRENVEDAWREFDVKFWPAFLDDIASAERREGTS